MPSHGASFLILLGCDNMPVSFTDQDQRFSFNPGSLARPACQA